ncbi:MAG TPA: hypothetical protein VIM41_14665, partial [Gammaproteobacteria bacterium]
MRKGNKLQLAALLAVGLLTVAGFVGCAGTGGGQPAAEQKGADKMPAHQDDAKLSHDYRTFMAGGETKYGQIGDSYTADLVLYLAGN